MKELSFKGAADLTDTVRRVMKSVVTHQVEMEYNWSGAKGRKRGDEAPEVKALKSLKLSSAVTS